MNEEIDLEFTYVAPAGTRSMVAVSADELAALRATDAAVQAAYAAYRAEWASFGAAALLSCAEWLEWLAGDAYVIPLHEEVHP